MEQNQIAAAGGAESLDRFRNLLRARHAGRHDDRLAGLCHTAHERKIDHFERSDFVGRWVKALEKFNRAVVERSREDRNAQFASLGKQRGVPVPRGMSLFVQLIELPAIPQAAVSTEMP